MKKVVVISLMVLFASAVIILPASADNAAEVFQLRCATCHGTDGQGTVFLAPGVSTKFVKEGSDKDIRDVIRNGRYGVNREFDGPYPNMPSFGVGMVPNVDDLVKYIKEKLQR